MFKVRSVEEAVCICKLAYFNLFTAIREATKVRNTTALREITELEIRKAGLNPSCEGWMHHLGSVYFEVYSQWLNSSNTETLEEWTAEYDRFVVVDRRKDGNLTENQVLSSFNILGLAIHKAINLVEVATMKKTREKPGPDGPRSKSQSLGS